MNPISWVEFNSVNLNDALNLMRFSSKYEVVVEYSEHDQAFVVLRVRDTESYLLFIAPSETHTLVEPFLFLKNGEDARDQLTSNNVKFYGMLLKKDGSLMNNYSDISTYSIGNKFNLKDSDTLQIKVVKKIKKRIFHLEVLRNLQGEWSYAFTCK
ncbi:MAG: hypothetical protein ACSHX0_10460 [Akkermansiaceae bacterium]